MIILIESTSSALSVSWPAVEGAIRYKLEYRRSAEDEYATLSGSLTQTQARKRNLKGDDGFFFRVGAITSENQTEVKTWVTHTDPFKLLTIDEEELRMDAPKVVHAGSNLAVIVTWSEYDKTGESNGYELQMRENSGGATWETIAPSLVGTQVRKKNLTSRLGYQFRVRPSSSNIPFSPPSDVLVAQGLSNGMKNLFRTLNVNLLENPSTPIPTANALGGKEFVLLYASAHWCGPCRKYTPQLASWYNSIGKKSRVEVVFLSCDHDENEFQSYYSSMPWLAVPFDEDGRENLLGYIKVRGVPRVTVLDSLTGRIIEENAVGKPLDIKRWRKLAEKVR